MKKRIDVSPEAGALSHNPFAALGSVVPNGLPEHAAVTPDSAQALKPWSVARTQKGGFAISLERRANGKQVTVLRNVSGDAETLLKILKRRCGAGGVVREGAIELQGDHRIAVADFLVTGS